MNKEQEITMKSGSTFKIPTSWTVENSGEFVKAIGPEKDVTVYLLESKETENLGQLIVSSWEKIGKQGYPIQIEAPQPAPAGWKKAYVVVYEVPQSDSKMVCGSLVTFQGHAYITLMTGSLAGVSRRGADLALIGTSWKPKGFVEPSIANAVVGD